MTVFTSNGRKFEFLSKNENLGKLAYAMIVTASKYLEELAGKMCDDSNQSLLWCRVMRRVPAGKTDTTRRLMVSRRAIGDVSME